MDFRFSAEDEGFRGEVEAFLDAEMPRDWMARVSGTGVGAGGDIPEKEWEFSRSFQKKLAEKGWLTLSWPREHGGLGVGYVRQALFAETLARRRAPYYNQGVDRVGPTIMRFGSAEQQARFLPPIRSGTVFYCQGFSETGAGSDLAGVRTRAELDGDDYVINGAKVWTSHAHQADMIFLIARTDREAPKHKGISYFLVDMHSPGIKVRPLVDMAGNHHFNEVFFEDVRAPAANRIGEENQGWYAAATSLDFERSGIGRVVASIRTLQELMAFAKKPGPDGRRPVDDDRVRQRLAELQIEFAVGKLLAYRVAWMLDVGIVPTREASVSKLFGSEVQQRLAGLINLGGLAGALEPGSAWAPLGGRLAREYVTSIPLTIAAGTSEILRNIIATRGLGLPRE